MIHDNPHSWYGSLRNDSQTFLPKLDGLLARYEQMTLLERLHDKVGRRDGIPGLWLLIPGDQEALMDGKAVPLISPGHRPRIPVLWIENRHGSNLKVN